MASVPTTPQHPGTRPRRGGISKTSMRIVPHPRPSQDMIRPTHLKCTLGRFDQLLQKEHKILNPLYLLLLVSGETSTKGRTQGNVRRSARFHSKEGGPHWESAIILMSLLKGLFKSLSYTLTNRELCLDGNVPFTESARNHTRTDCMHKSGNVWKRNSEDTEEG